MAAMSLVYRSAGRKPTCLLLLALQISAALMVAVATLRGSALAQDRNPPLPQIELRAGMHRIVAEVAANDETRSRGLMFREQLATNHGMLFIFQQASPYCFWMKNTPLALSIAFLRDDGTITNIADMQPHSEKSHCAREPVRFALEMEQGWFVRKGLREGSRIAHPKLFGSP
jgi:uncharacterized membrane protein (UPF0127 family)